MAGQSKAQKETIERVMHELKHGELRSGSGRKVRDPKQAIAIALHEAGATSQDSPARNRASLRRTKARERSAGQTRAELYEEAKRKGLPGRSRMSKAELVRALHAG